ncbi:FhaA domain-containing protein [Kytococcus sedentarius]|uniref:FhaA domain-containing protein n=1 Tax=Kytococcus sedentarius TaxID=1276 RepID=UPI0035BC5B66
MGLLDRFESGTERVFTAPFARLFKREQLQPVEIGAAIRKAMDSRAAVVNRHRTIVPNVFTIELSDDDFDRLIAFDEAITDELIADAQEYVTQQRYTPGGPLQIELVADPDLQPGIYKLHHATVRNPATLDERGDIDAWGATHERFDDAIDRHTSGHRIPSDARYLGEVDEEAIAAARAAAVDSEPEPQPEELSPREERRRAKEQAKEERRAAQEEERREAERRETEEAEAERRQAEEAEAERLRREEDERRRAEEAEQAERARREAAEEQVLAHQTGREEYDREAAIEQQREEIRQAERAQRERAVAAQEASAEQTQQAPVADPTPTRSTRSVERPWVEVDGTRHPLTAETTLVGRDVSCDITVSDPGISRRHVELRTEEVGGRTQVSIRDLGSTNGTYVGGEQIRNARLADGDTFTMGRTTLTVRLGRTP